MTIPKSINKKTIKSIIIGLAVIIAVIVCGACIVYTSEPGYRGWQFEFKPTVTSAITPTPVVVDENKTYTAYYSNDVFKNQNTGDSITLTEHYKGVSTPIFKVNGIDKCNLKTVLIYYHEKYGMDSVASDYWNTDTFEGFMKGWYDKLHSCNTPSKMTIAELESPYIAPTPLPTEDYHKWYVESIITPQTTSPTPTPEPNAFKRIYYE